jgi:hypothetical protein
MGGILGKFWGPNSHAELTTLVSFEGVNFILI